MRFTQDLKNEMMISKFLYFKQLKEELIPYLAGDELHPRRIYASDGPSIDWSWGYQLKGLALEQTMVAPEEFQDFVEECRLNNIGGS